MFAGSYCRRFKKKGFESSQRQLMAGLAQAGYQDATLLEIGCGVGHLHQTLLERGARSAVGIDVAPTMVETARGWAQERGLSQLTDYHVGDFMTMTDSLESSDVVLLDKVVCCYPDAKGLMHESLGKTQRVVALTLPRNRWYVRIGIAIVASLFWLIRSQFRPYLYDPQLIERWIREAGFEKQFEDHTLIWLTQVFVRRCG